MNNLKQISISNELTWQWLLVLAIFAACLWGVYHSFKNILQIYSLKKAPIPQFPSTLFKSWSISLYLVLLSLSCVVIYFAAVELFFRFRLVSYNDSVAMFKSYSGFTLAEIQKRNITDVRFERDGKMTGYFEVVTDTGVIIRSVRSSNSEIGELMKRSLLKQE